MPQLELTQILFQAHIFESCLPRQRKPLIARDPLKSLKINNERSVAAQIEKLNLTDSATSPRRSFSQPKIKPTLKSNLLQDYGQDIKTHLKSFEMEVNQKEFLIKHQISTEFRGKMVDWMVEVLNTFKCSDQTLFLAVNIIDRYFKLTDKILTASDLHLTGIVAMFIASKYEDVIPLLMRTVLNKIGHNKFQLQDVEQKEMDILRVLSFKIGAPTVKEYIDRYIEENSSSLPQTSNFINVCTYIAKVSTHNYKLMQLPSSLLGAVVMRVALKMFCNDSIIIDQKQIMSCIIDFAEIKDSGCFILASKDLLSLTRNFDKICPNFKNLRLVYNEEIKSLQ